ncbi:DUF7093 family protein [Natronomonas sp. EA1]|uniref:DUF7093 family protein n=1 Tax=Natronomonas sp. EA1 TaxID=3421655 RepID=UPI003EB6EA11
MGFKCSLLGHDFADPETEREREERGDEVVTTIREIAHCTRCDESKVVSESKEVTAIVEPETVDAQGIDQHDEDAYEEPTGTPRQDTEEPIPDDTGAADEEVEAEEDDRLAPPDEATAEAIESLADRDPEEEDAEILDDGEEPTREPGQWPDDDEPWDPTPSPATEPEAVESDAAEPTTEGATEEAATDAALTTEPTDDGLLVPDGAYVCPECGFTTSVDGSSLRAGDACPECHRGYLEGERNS